MWNYFANGHYMVKSGYWVTLDQIVLEWSETSISQDQHKVSVMETELKIPPKVTYFI